MITRNSAWFQKYLVSIIEPFFSGAYRKFHDKHKKNLQQIGEFILADIVGESDSVLVISSKIPGKNKV